jgi:hypothetical protein
MTRDVQDFDLCSLTIKRPPRKGGGSVQNDRIYTSQRIECLDLYSLGVVPTYFLNTFEK